VVGGCCGEEETGPLTARGMACSPLVCQDCVDWSGTAGGRQTAGLESEAHRESEAHQPMCLAASAHSRRLNVCLACSRLRVACITRVPGARPRGIPVQVGGKARRSTVLVPHAWTRFLPTRCSSASTLSAWYVRPCLLRAVCCWHPDTRQRARRYGHCSASVLIAARRAGGVRLRFALPICVWFGLLTSVCVCVCVDDQGYLVKRFGSENEREDWERVLSVGEQQRLLFARLLLRRPAFAILDESTRSRPSLPALPLLLHVCRPRCALWRVRAQGGTRNGACIV